MTRIDLLGAGDFTPEQASVPAKADNGLLVTVRLKDAVSVAKTQGGALGALAAWAAPGTITTTVYSKVADEIGKGLKEKGIDAEVSAVTASSLGVLSHIKSDTKVFFLASAGAGSAIGIGWFGWWLIKRFLLRRR